MLLKVFSDLCFIPTCLETYEELRKWSVTNCADFWEIFWKYADILHSQTYEEVLDQSQPMETIPEWFHGARLNFAENLLRYDDDKVALYTAGKICFPNSELQKNIGATQKGKVPKGLFIPLSPKSDQSQFSRNNIDT